MTHTHILGHIRDLFVGHTHILGHIRDLFVTHTHILGHIRNYLCTHIRTYTEPIHALVSGHTLRCISSYTRNRTYMGPLQTHKQDGQGADISDNQHHVPLFHTHVIGHIWDINRTYMGYIIGHILYTQTGWPRC